MSAKEEKTVDQLLCEMSLLNFEVGSQFYAKPTYVVDPHNFYIIPFPFLYYLTLLSKPGPPIAIENLKKHKIVVFTSKNPDVNKYFKIDLDANIRGVIQHVSEDNKCLIYALDRGFIEKDVSLDRIFHPASEDARDMPSLIQHCQMHSCAPIGDDFSKDAIEAFKFYIGNEKLSVVIRGKSVDRLKVTVYNSNPDDVSTLLALTHYTYLTSCVVHDLGIRYIRNEDKPTLAYQHIEVCTDQVFTVRVQSGSSLSSFYVTPISAFKEYQENRADFTYRCKSLPEIKPEEFVIGGLVGVEDNASCFYERGVILKVLDSEKAKVKLVDWGTELEVSRCRIKPLKARFFLSYPVCALFCSAVEGFVPWDSGLSNILYKRYIFTIKVKSVGRGFEAPHVVALAKA